MESFGEIIDPETNKNVSVQSAVGKQVIKNYLECLKNGPDSKNILSTKMFYKTRSLSAPKLKGGSSLSKGSVRGKCSLCNKNVYSTQERVKSSGNYLHEKCYQTSKKH